ncbi:MAG: peptidase inhibitor family I36 protein [Burkholderiaceae bacterium]
MNTRPTFSVRTSGASRTLALPTSMLLTAVLAACGGGNGQPTASTDSANNAVDTAAAIATAAAAASPVCFYEHVNYQGASFCASVDSNWVGGAWNDRVSSVKVAAGYKVTLFQDINYGGKSLVLNGDTTNLVTLGFNDAASSFKLTAPPVATSKVGTVQIAQSQLFNSDDAALVLVSNKVALLKVNVVATTVGAAKPTGRLHVDNVNGGSSTDILLAAPTSALPSVVPDVPSFADSYTATIPAEYVKPGLRLAVHLDAAAATTLTPKAGGGVAMKFVPIAVNIAGTVGTRPVDQAPHLQSLFPVSSVSTQQHVTYTSTKVTTLPTTDDGWSDAFGKVLGELADLHSLEGAGSQDHYFGFIPKRTWGLAGLGYVGGSSAVGFDMPSAPTSVRDVVSHELGHNFSLQHAACGGAGNPDPNYPYPDADLSKPGRVVWPFLADERAFYDPRPTDRHDIMSYCGGQVFSDYNYTVMQTWLYPGNKTLKTAALSAGGSDATATPAGEPREVLLVSGEIGAAGTTLNPVKSFVGRVATAGSGTYVLRVVTAGGTTDYSFTPLQLDHDAKTQHFGLVIPNTGPVVSVTVLLQGKTLTQARAASAGSGDKATVQSTARESVPLQLKEAAGQLSLTWDVRASAFATLTWVSAAGQRMTLAQDLRGGSAQISTAELPAGGTFEVILSDGLNSTRQSVRR